MGNRVTIGGSRTAHKHNESISGFTELLRCINNQRWVDARLRVKSHGVHEACIWYVEQIPPNKILDKMLPLHRACELNAPEELIQALLTVFLDGVKLRDYGNMWLPLHFCCASVGSVTNGANNYAAVNLLLGAFEEGARAKDQLGRLPLHLACENQNGISSKDVVEILLGAFPDAVKTKDKEGRLPLHCACQNLASEEVIQMLLWTYPDSTAVPDYKGKFSIDYMKQSAHPNKMKILDTLKKDPLFWRDMRSRRVQGNKTVEGTAKTELYRLIERKHWVKVIDRAKQNPGEARKWYVLRQSDSTGKGSPSSNNNDGANKSCWWRQLPIHELCKLQPPTAVMDAVLEAYPEGAQTVDHYSILPIHLACWGNASPGVVSCLITAYPNGVRVKDEKGMLPLHSACWGGACEEVINLLIKVYPQSIDVVDNYGRTPLKIMTERDQDSPVKEIIIASLTSGRHKTEVYKLIECFDWATVIEQLQISPLEASIPYIVKDSYGEVLSCKLPLHLACQLDAPVEVIEELLNTYPLAVFYKGNGDSLPIHFACAKGASEGVIETLLRAYPLSVYEKDIDGKDPLFYVSENSYPHKKVVTDMLQRDPSYWKAPKVTTSLVLSESTDRTELFRLIVKNEWQEATKRCNNYPQEAKVLHVLKDEEGRTRCRELPIHQACRLNPPLDIVETLINAYLDGPQTRDSFGDLPAHLACENGASEDVITVLVKSNPLAVHEADSEGRTPLVILQEKGHPKLPTLIDMMIVEASQWNSDTDDSDAGNQDRESSQMFSMDRMKDTALGDWLNEDDKSGFGDWMSVDKMSTASQSGPGVERRSSHLSHFSHVSYISMDSNTVDSYAPLDVRTHRRRAPRRRSSRIAIPLGS